MRRLLLSIVFVLTGLSLQAQEFRCNVSIVSPNVQGSNKQVFQTLQNAIYEFMNNRIWTDHVYAAEERIEVTMMFNITDQPSADEFKGTLQVQVRRPVFNTSLNTTTLNFVDNDLHFNYVEFSPLEFDLNTHQSSLTSLLAFYAYFILGIDYDSFALKGGDQYFNNAERVVLNAQNANAPEAGWKPMDDLAHKCRYWLVKDMLDTDYEPLREFNYRYHRLGLDVMDEKVAEGRAEITNSLELLQGVFRKRPDPYMYPLSMLFSAKADELVNIYTESFPEERTRAHTILTEVDKTNTNKYKAILEQKI